jgi:hypothetical protein
VRYPRASNVQIVKIRRYGDVKNVKAALKNIHVLLVVTKVGDAVSADYSKEVCYKVLLIRL